MAQTHQGGKFYLCTTAQTPTINQAAFEALTYVEVGGVVTAPSFQISDNMLTQNTLADDIAQKQKGFRQAEDTELVCALDMGDSGQNAMITAARTKLIYAVKYELDDAPPAGTPTTVYALALIGGGGTVGGGGEDFVNRVFQIGVTHQFPIEVEAA